MPVGSAIGGAVVSAAGSVAGGLIQKSATDSANATQKAMYDQTMENLSPYLKTGETAANMLTANLDDLTKPITMDQATLEQTPGYKFNLQQGLKSTQNSAAARGLGNSGAALKGAASYATGLADSTYQNQFNNANTNKQNTYNFLTGASNLGANAAATGAGAATQTGSSMAQTTTSGGTALAAGLTGATNALTSGANSVGGYNYANQLLQSGRTANMYKAA